MLPSHFRAIAAALILFAASFPASAATTDWPMLGHDAARSGSTAVELRPPFERKWYRLFADEGLMAGVQPVVAEGKVFVGTLRGMVHAIDAETGIDAWTYQAGGPLMHACAVEEGKVFFGAADGMIYALRAADGKLAWSAPTGAGIWNAPCVHGGGVFIGSRDGALYACSAADGKIRWKAATGGPILNSPALDIKAGIVYVGSEDMHVYAFAIADGRQVWTSPKLPGVSLRGYHPVIAPDGAVMVTVTPCICGEICQQLPLDMVKEIFGDFASWRHNKQDNERLRDANFELMKDPRTYARQLDYLRKRLTDAPALQTFFVLDPATGKPRFVAPIVYGESMNGPGAPPLVADGKVIVKYWALLRSRYQHYSPFLNVGYLDTATGNITPVMDQSRTYGWHDSLLLVHDEMCRLTVGGRVLFNAHQDNVNAMDLDTLKGYAAPMCWGVHEVKPGVGAAIWTELLHGNLLPVGWEWLGRGTAVYGGGSAIDTPIVIAGDSFYFLPTHEINSGVAIIAYRMQKDGSASQHRPDPSAKLTAEDIQKIATLKWDWDSLEGGRLKSILNSLPEKVPGTLGRPRTAEADAAIQRITDEQLDQIIWQHQAIDPHAAADSALLAPVELAEFQARLARAVEELIAIPWRPLVFPAGKFPTSAYRMFTDPSETLYTLALAFPHVPAPLQEKVRTRVAEMMAASGALAPPIGRRAYDLHAGDDRAAYDPAPDALLKFAPDLLRSDTARLYPCWLWAQNAGDFKELDQRWPALRGMVSADPVLDKTSKLESDCGNGRVAGLIAACRIARRLHDDAFLQTWHARTRAELRRRMHYEFSYTEGGVILAVPDQRCIFGRWRFLTPEIGRACRLYAAGIERHLMDVYVDHHRPNWWVAWNIEMLIRNECNFAFPTESAEIFTARAFMLDEKPAALAKFVDLPWCRADEYYIQKLAMLLNQASRSNWRAE